jgi:hypothetical protein
MRGFFLFHQHPANGHGPALGFGGLNGAVQATALENGDPN